MYSEEHHHSHFLPNLLNDLLQIRRDDPERWTVATGRGLRTLVCEHSLRLLGAANLKRLDYSRTRAISQLMGLTSHRWENPVGGTLALWSATQLEDYCKLVSQSLPSRFLHDKHICPILTPLPYETSDPKPMMLCLSFRVGEPSSAFPMAVPGQPPRSNNA